MKFTKVDRKDINRQVYSKMQKFILEFSDSLIAIAEVTEYTHKTPESCAWGITASAKRLNMPHISGSVRDGKCYIINSLIDNKD